MTFGTFLLGFIVSWFFYLPLAGVSLAYHGIKYDVTENEVSQFYSELSETLRIIFQRKGFFFKDTLFPNLDQKLQKPISLRTAKIRRLVVSVMPLIFPLATIIGLFGLTSISDIALYLFFLMCWCFLFYKCFFFGQRFEKIVKRRKTST
jgi:hypothetical protein